MTSVFCFSSSFCYNPPIDVVNNAFTKSCGFSPSTLLVFLNISISDSISVSALTLVFILTFVALSIKNKLFK